jgi:antitoxin component of MazEF toxin-antitoxin module
LIFWSRRIVDTNRPVYAVSEDRITIILCRYHYVIHCYTHHEIYAMFVEYKLMKGDIMKTVHLEQAITKVGNSSGIIIPANLLRELGVGVSDVVKIDITPKKTKPSFNIDQLMANTDFDSQRKDVELKEWDLIKSAGREIV